MFLIFNPINLINLLNQINQFNQLNSISSAFTKESPAKKDMAEAPNPGKKPNNPGLAGSKLTWKFPNEI